MENGMIQIKYLNKDIIRLEYIEGKSDWIDLRSAEHVVMLQGEYRLINLGVAMKLPKGYEALIIPRSSTYKNFGIIQANHIGLVDETYSGNDDWYYMPVIALRDTVININDRICQFRIQKHQPALLFHEVNELETQNRGGFGSTGIQ